MIIKPSSPSSFINRVEQKKCNQGMIVDGWAEEQVSKWRIITITEEEQLDSKLLWSCLSGRKLYQLGDDAKHCMNFHKIYLLIRKMTVLVAARFSRKWGRSKENQNTWTGKEDILNGELKCNWVEHKDGGIIYLIRIICENIIVSRNLIEQKKLICVVEHQE